MSGAAVEAVAVFGALALLAFALVSSRRSLERETRRYDELAAVAETLARRFPETPEAAAIVETVYRHRFDESTL